MMINYRRIMYWLLAYLISIPIIGYANIGRDNESGSERIEPRIFDNVVLISIDGLRSDALVSGTSALLPNFYRMLEHGSYTLNARTDPDFPVTLPGHVCILTGRLVNGEGGHSWVKNINPDAGETLQSHKGEYIAGPFDVAHDHGMYTALFSNKSKFSLFDVSWNEINGRDDTVLPDNGKDKIDDFRFLESAEDLTNAVTGVLGNKDNARSLTFVHYAQPDYAGHYHGWNLTQSSQYMKSIISIDTEIGKILDYIRNNKMLAGNTVVIITADHGGGGPLNNHERNDMWVNYIIPFMVWYDDEAPINELYEINSSSRNDPGIRKYGFLYNKGISVKEPLPPIYNADAANLTLELLGLPAISGSTINVKQDLEISSDKATVTTEVTTELLDN